MKASQDQNEVVRRLILKRLRINNNNNSRIINLAQKRMIFYKFDEQYLFIFRAKTFLSRIENQRD